MRQVLVHVDDIDVYEAMLKLEQLHKIPGEKTLQKIMLTNKLKIPTSKTDPTFKNDVGICKNQTVIGCI